MKIKWFLYAFLAFLLIMLLFLGIDLHVKDFLKPISADVFVGVEAGCDGVENIKSLVDEVKSYTNFFVVGSLNITYNVTSLNEVCQYIYDSGLHFTPFMHITNRFNQSQWTSYARQLWGNRFWGVYAYDEAGGHQIDLSYPTPVTEASNYSDAADKYVKNLAGNLSEFRFNDFPLLTSDYALHEFDYRAGYDAVLAEFGYNLSKPLQVALCRGAATMHNKDWGVMITWKYDTPPYIESGPELYNDMVMAYQNGAKYIVVFNYAKDPATNVTYSILRQEHLDALKHFWQYIKNNPRMTSTSEDRVAYVLPKDYGFGFRRSNDKIWGLWEADNLSSKIWNDVSTLVEQYKPRMDIIYEDDLQSSTFKYSKLIFWNGTTITNSATTQEAWKFVIMRLSQLFS
jgi:hypothetical protein